LFSFSYGAFFFTPLAKSFDLGDTIRKEALTEKMDARK
jgi:hypothetical protein